MRRTALMIAGALAAILAVSERAPEARSPKLEIRKVDAKALAAELAARRGAPLVVNYWATWCAPCIEELPELAKAARAWRARGVRFVSVSADDPDKIDAVRRSLARVGASFDALFLVTESEAVIRQADESWGGALPATFVYDASGKRAQKVLGGKVDRKMIDEWLTPLVKR